MTQLWLVCYALALVRLLRSGSGLELKGSVTSVQVQFWAVEGQQLLAASYRTSPSCSPEERRSLPHLYWLALISMLVPL